MILERASAKNIVIIGYSAEIADTEVCRLDPSASEYPFKIPEPASRWLMNNDGNRRQCS